MLSEASTTPLLESSPAAQKIHSLNLFHEQFARQLPQEVDQRCADFAKSVFDQLLDQAELAKATGKLEHPRQRFLLRHSQLKRWPPISTEDVLDMDAGPAQLPGIGKVPLYSEEEQRQLAQIPFQEHELHWVWPCYEELVATRIQQVCICLTQKLESLFRATIGDTPQHKDLRYYVWQQYLVEARSIECSAWMLPKGLDRFKAFCLPYLGAKNACGWE
jgi:hypothetical protein